MSATEKENIVEYGSFMTNLSENGSWDQYGFYLLGNGNFLAFIADAPVSANIRTGAFIQAHIESRKTDIAAFFRKDPKPEEASHFIADIFTRANEFLLSRDSGKSYATFTLAISWDEWIYIASVGDSPAYLVGKDRFVRMSEATRLGGGVMFGSGAADLPESPEAYKEGSYIGAAPRFFTAADVYHFPSEQYGLLCLCSDGVEGQLGVPALAEILRAGVGPKETAQNIKSRCDGSAPKDDLTALVVKITGKINKISRFALQINEDVTKLETALKSEIAALRNDFAQKINEKFTNLDTALKSEIATLRKEIATKKETPAIIQKTQLPSNISELPGRMAPIETRLSKLEKEIKNNTGKKKPEDDSEKNWKYREITKIVRDVLPAELFELEKTKVSGKRAGRGTDSDAVSQESQAGSNVADAPPPWAAQGEKEDAGVDSQSDEWETKGRGYAADMDILGRLVAFKEQIVRNKSWALLSAVCLIGAMVLGFTMGRWSSKTPGSKPQEAQQVATPAPPPPAAPSGGGTTTPPRTPVDILKKGVPLSFPALSLRYVPAVAGAPTKDPEVITTKEALADFLKTLGSLPDSLNTEKIIPISLALKEWDTILGVSNQYRSWGDNTTWKPFSEKYGISEKELKALNIKQGRRGRQGNVIEAPPNAADKIKVPVFQFRLLKYKDWPTVASIIERGGGEMITEAPTLEAINIVKPGQKSEPEFKLPLLLFQKKEEGEKLKGKFTYTYTITNDNELDWNVFSRKWHCVEGDVHAK